MVLVIRLELGQASPANATAHGQTIATDAASVASMEIGTITITAHSVATTREIRLGTATLVLTRESNNLILFRKKDPENPVYSSIPADYT